MYILCGFWCAGKSTAGKMCAEKLGCPFYDTDRLIESASGFSSCSQAWHELGEKAFRELETTVIQTLKKQSCIVALGGGSLLHPANREYVQKLGAPIYLKASIGVLYQRVLKRGFPASAGPLTYHEFEAIAVKRFAIFENHCPYMIESDYLNERELADKLWQAIISDRFSASPPGVSPTAKP